MILDGSRGWYWYLKSLPERVRKHDATVRFNIIEREIGNRFCASTMMDDESVIAYNIMDSDTLLGILFDESLKSKCIVAIDEVMGYDEVVYVDIVLVQGAEGCTNIDSEILEMLGKVGFVHEDI